MFNPDRLSQAVDLQERSYQLLLWMADAVRKGLIRFETAHDYSSFPDAAEEWIVRHYTNIPSQARPHLESLPEFCAFFSTYLENSFELIPEAGKQLYSPDAHCFCPWCSWFVDAPNLKTKKVTSSDKRKAHNLRRSAVQNMSAFNKFLISDHDVDLIVDDSDYRESTSLVAYAEDLLKRVQGIATGTAILALWRGFAWDASGSPKKKFQLTTDMILEAEERLCKTVLKFKPA